MIQTTGGKPHWNYFVALERDLEALSRYVEFCEQNFDVYSIEIAHLLFAAAAETEVVAKLLWERLQGGASPSYLGGCRDVILTSLPELPSSQVFVPRYGLTLTPWTNWGTLQVPEWWESYNRVKHQRHTHFDEAKLRHALNALSALLLLNFHFYQYELRREGAEKLNAQDTLNELQPASVLLQLPRDYYYSTLAFKV